MKLLPVLSVMAWLLMASATRGQFDAQPSACPRGRCPGLTPGAAPDAHLSGGIVRIVNAMGSARSLGSGTLIDKNSEHGLVLTCAHLFREGIGTVTVTFPSQASFGAKVLGVDAAGDLAALLIYAPDIEPIPIAESPPRLGETVSSCGYGSDGRLWCNRGQVLRYVSMGDASTPETLELSGSARQGDSGGPVLNERRELVAVLFGTNSRVVDGTCCTRIRRFIAQFSSRFRANDNAPPREEAPVPIPPAGPAKPHAAPREIVESWLSGKLLAVLAGVGLPGWIAAPAVWLAMRRVNRRLRARIEQLSTPREQPSSTSSADHAPIVVRDQSPPLPQIVERSREFVQVRVPTERLEALQWAMDELVRRSPGAQGTIETIEAYASQYQSGLKKRARQATSLS